MGIAGSGPEQRARDNNGAARKGSNHSFGAVQTYTNQNVNVKRSGAGNSILFNDTIQRRIQNQWVEVVVWSQAAHVAQLLGLNTAVNGMKT
jgi:hypothetical protein